MRARIEPHQTSILEKEQVRKREISELVQNLLHLTTKLRTSNGVNKRSLLAQINLIQSALRKVSRGKTRRGTPSRSIGRLTLGRH